MVVIVNVIAMTSVDSGWQTHTVVLGKIVEDQEHFQEHFLCGSSHE